MCRLPPEIWLIILDFCSNDSIALEDWVCLAGAIDVPLPHIWQRTKCKHITIFGNRQFLHVPTWIEPRFRTYLFTQQNRLYDMTTMDCRRGQLTIHQEKCTWSSTSSPKGTTHDIDLTYIPANLRFVVEGPLSTSSKQRFYRAIDQKGENWRIRIELVSRSESYLLQVSVGNIPNNKIAWKVKQFVVSSAIKINT